MATLFTRIIEGEIPSYRVAEDAEFYAFLDINPVQPGHTLVVPRQEVDYVFDIDDDLLGRMMVFAKQVARQIQTVTKVPQGRCLSSDLRSTTRDIPSRAHQC